MNTILIQVNGKIDLEFKLPKKSKDSLSAMQKAVEGYIEVVYPPIENTKMFVNEDGISKELDTNIIATGLFGNVILGNTIVETSNSMVVKYIQRAAGILNSHPLGYNPN